MPSWKRAPRLERQLESNVTIDLAATLLYWAGMSGRITFLR